MWALHTGRTLLPRNPGPSRAGRIRYIVKIESCSGGISSSTVGVWRSLGITVFGTYQDESTIMRKVFDWKRSRISMLEVKHVLYLDMVFKWITLYSSFLHSVGWGDDLRNWIEFWLSSSSLIEALSRNLSAGSRESHDPPPPPNSG
jgi:hypothetical protein